MQLWIVQQAKTDDGGAHYVFEFQGIFDSKDKAVAACRTDQYVMFPATLNESLPHETLEGPLGEYPLEGK